MAEKDDKKAEKKLKEAPSNLPQTGVKTKWWVTTLGVILMMAWVAVAMIGSQILVMNIMYWTLPIEFLTTTTANTMLSLISYVLMILFIWVPGRVPKIRDFVSNSKERMGLNGMPTWTDLGLAPVGYVVSLIVGGVITMIFSSFSWFNADEAQELGYSLYMQGWERGLAFIELVVVAPIMEELLFRGWLYGNLRVKIPKWLAILLVSVLFGLIHFQWNVGISVFVLSIVACILREVTGNIYAGTLVHMINNGVAFLLVYVIGMNG